MVRQLVVDLPEVAAGKRHEFPKVCQRCSFYAIAADAFCRPLPARAPVPPQAVRLSRDRRRNGIVSAEPVSILLDTFANGFRPLEGMSVQERALSSPGEARFSRAWRGEWPQSVIAKAPHPPRIARVF